MDNIILFSDKASCCGCGACENICPKNAISMKRDAYGFVYPQIEPTLCIHCGQCRRVCRFQSDARGNEPLEVFAAAANDDAILQTSSSGGAFAVFARKILQAGGAVFGCASVYEKGKLRFSHIMIEKLEDLPKLQGSKYVKSNIGHTYAEARTLLQSGRQVLFSGTPCQIDGLLGYLGDRDYANLITVDIICHGVPSEKMFQDYIALEEQRCGMSVCGFDFRSKQEGWGSFSFVERCRKKNGKETVTHKFARRSSYYWLFLKGAIYRETCYCCKYAGKNRVGDLTIGDFWGIETVHPQYLDSGELDGKKGISCILANSEKGIHFLQSCGEAITCKASTFAAAALRNGQLSAPTNRHPQRDVILERYRQEGYAGVDQWYKKQLGVKYFLYLGWDCIPRKWKAKLKSALKKGKS